jgi:hypothetical protein
MENLIFISTILIIFFATIAFLTRHDKPQEKKGE